MFQYSYPRFEKGRVLKTEMLASVRDYPRSLVDVRYHEYSDGIITGAQVTVNERELTIAPGLIKHQGRLYVLEQQQHIEYDATGVETILKVRFYENGSDRDFERYTGEIVLEEEIDSNSEIELGRFKLKHGAVLRSEYVDFADLVTEYNTFHTIHIQYSGIGEATVSPFVFRWFARELFAQGASHPNPLDLSFGLMCLNEERIQRAAVLSYLSARFGHPYREMDNIKIHHSLERVLAENGGRRGKSGMQRSGPQRMLVD
ncbi:hypothetical protein [Paenibacillus dauci]|uniref:hypothetical protein n=1 Tax=Paenibacillus dauci TaxID=1567106 RepID=UPI000619C6A8|nr:hypothetical protein [Paenibacillus dauci]